MSRYGPVRSNHVRWRAIGDEVVLYNSITDSYFQLNIVGATIWELLDGSFDLEQIIAAVVEEYSVDHDTAQADVQEYLNELQSKGMIEI